ncbi:TRAP transporter small permease [Halomonas sp. AOP12-C2-37]|uniref:TRAP transporter small permease n=1 Tax=unclassified Halomonas TaxID=2609666 RepID=UPI004034563F
MNKLDIAIGHVLRGIAILCLSALFILLFVNVFARGFQLASFAWLDEVVQGLFAWMVFMGAAALWREGSHFRVDWLEKTLSQRYAAPVLKGLIALLSVVFFLTMAWYGWRLTERSSALTPVLNLPIGLFYVSIPIAGVLMSAYSLRDVFIALKEIKTNSINCEKELLNDL